MQIAFVLGAGLGTRLRPLTDDLPKPLVPVGGRPLITYAFDHLAGLGAGGFVVNTHHRPGRYVEAFPGGRYLGMPLSFVHEPVLLETGGGIANALSELPPGQHLAVYNGDILTDVPLAGAWEQHQRSGDLATLVLRSAHPDLRVTFDPGRRRVTDLRGALDPTFPARHGFAGVAFYSPEFLERLPPPAVYSVIDVLTDLLRRGAPVGGFCEDRGHWADLGDRDAYLDIHARLGSQPQVDEEADIDPGAKLLGATWVGAGASVGPGAVVRDSVLWPGAAVAAGASLHRCVVRTGRTASGRLRDIDV